MNNEETRDQITEELMESHKKLSESFIREGDIMVPVELTVIPRVQTQEEFIREYLDTKILPLFATKSGAYNVNGDEFGTIRSIAAKHLPEMYEDNQWEAMIKVVDILLEKHLSAIAKGPSVFEYEERLRDLLIYTFFKCRFVAEMNNRPMSGEIRTEMEICHG